MISLRQIRAACGLLEWSQAELARRCDLSATAMNNILRGHAAPRAGTLEQIAKCLENNGVAFLPGEGVRLRDDIFEVETFQGKNAFENYMGDVLETLPYTQDKAGYHMIADEEPYLTVSNLRRVFFYYIEDMIEKGLHDYILCRPGVKRIYGPPECASYRTAPAVLARQMGTSVYGDKYTLFLPDRIVVIENAAIAAAQRDQFLENWNHARSLRPGMVPVYEQDKAWLEKERKKKTRT